MSNVKEGDFCTHTKQGGLQYVVKSHSSDADGDILWYLRLLSPSKIRKSDIDPTIRTASPGEEVFGWDSRLRRVDPIEDPIEFNAQNIIEAALQRINSL